MKSVKPFYIANAIHRIGETNNWSSIMVLDYANVMAKNGASLSAEEIQRVKNAANRINIPGYQSGGSMKFDSKSVQIRYDFYQELKKLGILGVENYIGDYFSKRLEIVYEDSALNVTKEINQQKLDVVRNGVENATQVLNETYDLAASNPAFKQAIDNVFAIDFNCYLDATEEEIRRLNPGFDNFLQVNDLLDKSNNLISSNSDLKNVISDKLDRILQGIKNGEEESEDKIREIAGTTAFTKDRVRDILDKIALEQLEKDKAELSKWEDYSIQSVISLATMLIGDPKFTKGVSAVTSAAFEIKSLLNQYNSINTMSTLGTIGLVSGYASIGFALYNAFNTNDQQNADSLILETLQKISDQIENLRKQVMEGIFILDKKMDQYFEITNENLNYIIQYLHGMGIDLKNVGISLKNISLQMNMYWKDIDTKLDYLIDGDLEHAISYIENYKSLYEIEMDVNEFRGLVLKIFQIIDDSRKSLFTGNKEIVEDEEQLFLEIENKGPADLINLLRAIVSGNSGYKLVNSRVNPYRLGICMNLLSRLAIEHPNTFKQFKVAKYYEVYNELRQQKQEIQDIRMNKLNSLRGTLTKLIDNYLSSIDSFQDEVQKIYHEELIKNEEIKDKSYDNILPRLIGNYLEILNPMFESQRDIFNHKEAERAFLTLYQTSFEHAKYSDWSQYINGIFGITDFGVIDSLIEDNTYQYRGNVSFPMVRLNENAAKELLYQIPSLIFLLNLGIVEITGSYFASYSGFTRRQPVIPGYSVSPIEHGYPILFYHIYSNDEIIAKPIIMSPAKNVIRPDTLGSLIPLKDLVPNNSFWNYDYSSMENFMEFSERKNNLDIKLQTFISNYIAQIKGRLLSDANDMSSDLYKKLSRIEGNASLIKNFLKFILDGANSDLLSYFFGDINFIQNSHDNGISVKFVQLLDSSKIQSVISSFVMDASNIEESIGSYDFYLFGPSFIEKNKETVAIIAEEIKKCIDNIENGKNKIDNHQIIFETLLASRGV
ncbi:hypothetical protein I6I98_13250 [Sphingobacterium multivorum]|uniref:Uncharacterized protein n=1 Tax=Sphingobacterium multivorum TaxID=28454 RepID=A0ABX7D0F8_SPHMU|nr:hypothetical protein [Sphingobacterium multivorum]QQT56167.1 hypothetical protein I6I98_13250 [Sphingobacterium multivorum]